jgi:hypothetical protein
VPEENLRSMVDEEEKKGRAEKLKEEIRFRHGDNLIISISFFRAFFVSALCFLFFSISSVYLDSFF